MACSSPHDVIPRAKAAAQRAIDIAGTMSSPFATLGCLAAVYDWAWPEAERQYRRAIELNPEHPAAHHWYAINYLVPLKRFDEADTELRRAVGADPLSMPIRVSLGLRSYFAHRYAQGPRRAQRELRARCRFRNRPPVSRIDAGGDGQLLTRRFRNWKPHCRSRAARK